MRIGVDGRALRASRPRRGVAVYLERLLASWRGSTPGRVPRAGAGRRSGPARSRRTWRWSGSAGSGRALYAAAALVGRPRLDGLLGRPDVLWAPAPAPLAVSRGTAFVLTVHDLSFVHRPRDYALRAPLAPAGAPAAAGRRAHACSSDSEAVRAELVDEWGLPPERVRTVEPGPGRAIAAAAGRLRGRPATAHVLAVGALEPRKLPLLLVEAHRARAQRGLRGRPRVRGRRPARGELEAGGRDGASARPRRGARRRLRGALCLACVSREEGFGFTPLEALAAGVPAGGLRPAGLRARRSATGRCGCRPAMRTRWRKRCCASSASRSCARDSSAAARRRVELLSWERAARETRAVFEEAAA